MNRKLAIAIGVLVAIALAFVAARYWPSKHSLLEPSPAEESQPRQVAGGCVQTGDGFLRARLDGALDLKLDWPNAETLCEGMPRPDNNGVRVSFSRAIDGERRLVIVFGIAGLSESSSGHALPANVTIIEEGLARIYSTLGDDKCTVDDVKQQLITPWRKESRTYRVSGRGFCVQPARSVGGDATVLMSTFDFVGQVIYTGADSSTDTTHTT